MGKLFGGAPGGLAVSVVAVGALLAASTGIVGATVVTMGLISLPTMRNKYSPSLATGDNSNFGYIRTSYSTIYCLDYFSRSIGRSASDQAQLKQSLYKNAFGELYAFSFRCDVNICWGYVLKQLFTWNSFSFIVFCLYFWNCIYNPKLAPAVPKDNWDLINNLCLKFFFNYVTFSFDIFGFGIIIFSLATVNQSGAIGEDALIISGYKFLNDKKCIKPNKSILSRIALLKPYK